MPEPERDAGNGNGNGNPPDAGRGPGASPVRLLGILLINAYLALLTIALIYALLVVWPTPTPSREARPENRAPETKTEGQADTRGQSDDGNRASQDPQPPPSGSLQSPIRCPGEPCQVSLFGWHIWIWDEQRLLLIVVLAGALGSLVHALRSVYWYVGNRTLVRSWLAMYLVLPLAGGALGLIFYLVVRGGFFSPQSSFEQTSPFGFAAFAALIGMFSQQAVLKLQSVAETLFTKPEPGADPTPQNPESDE